MGLWAAAPGTSALPPLRLALDSRRFTLCTIEDCSQQKRLAVLTRIFFHDVLNTAGCVRGYAQLLTDSLPKDWQETEEARRLAGLVDQLIEEIESQRDLTRAESGELAIDPVPVEVRGLLGDLDCLVLGPRRCPRSNDCLGERLGGQYRERRPPAGACFGQHAQETRWRRRSRAEP